jgi:hypothetical protein
MHAERNHKLSIRVKHYQQGDGRSVVLMLYEQAKSIMQTVIQLHGPVATDEDGTQRVPSDSPALAAALKFLRPFGERYAAGAEQVQLELEKKTLEKPLRQALLLLKKEAAAALTPDATACDGGKGSVLKRPAAVDACRKKPAAATETPPAKKLQKANEAAGKDETAGGEEKGQDETTESEGKSEPAGGEEKGEDEPTTESEPKKKMAKTKHTKAVEQASGSKDTAEKKIEQKSTETTPPEQLPAHRLSTPPEQLPAVGSSIMDRFAGW